MTTNNKTPEERAAQIWCEPAHGKKVMDADFAMSIARAIREAVDEERERCVEIAERMLNEAGHTYLGDSIATAIRAAKEEGK